MRDSFDDVSALAAIVRRGRGERVVVLGDLMMDEFVYGRTDRVSREAPVVVVRYDGSGFSPGGAANAAQNVAALGGRAVPVGFVGDDERGGMLRSLLAGAGVATAGILVFRDRFTTTKMRLMAGDYHAQRQQIVRVDREQRNATTAREESRLIARFRREAAKAAAVVLSDYQQGVFSERIIAEAIAFCRERSIPVVADSRFRLGSFRGVTTAVPNEVEAHAAAGTVPGRDPVDAAGRRLLKELGSDSVVVTRGRFGMSLFRRRRPRFDLDVVGSAEATDVTGAGDTVAATIALSLAAKADIRAAMLLANAAASIVVMKRGTAVADAAELAGLLGKPGKTGEE